MIVFGFPCGKQILIKDPLRYFEMVHAVGDGADKVCNERMIHAINKVVVHYAADITLARNLRQLRSVAQIPSVTERKTSFCEMTPSEIGVITYFKFSRYISYDFKNNVMVKDSLCDYFAEVSRIKECDRCDGIVCRRALAMAIRKLANDKNDKGFRLIAERSAIDR